MITTPPRIAGAPITWGVCEAPGWGHQMSPTRVLDEIAGLGLTATEAGPDGFLPADPGELARTLDRHGLELAAGFVPVVLHQADTWPRHRSAAVDRIRALAQAGAEVAVVAAATGAEGYEGTDDLDESGWRHLGEALAELSRAADEAGIALTLHPHYGTVVERPDQVERFLAVSDVPVCLDTGHVMVGGGDPVDLARRVAARIRHVHLKDVDAALADRVRRGDMSYKTAVGEGMYRPLGEGDVDIGAVVGALDEVGFEGWFVLEQDTVLVHEPPSEEGPRLAAEASLRHLEGVIAGPGVERSRW